MAGAAFERLRAIMGEPAYTPAQVPWELAPAELGVQLPSDYRAFIDLYGAVNLNGEWGLTAPVRTRPDGTPDGFADWRTRSDGELRELVHGEDEFWGQDHTPVFPDPGGLLSWAVNSNHAHCCWLTTGPDPDRWPVAVFDCGGLDGALDVHEGGFAQFVTTVLTGGYAHQDELLVTPTPGGWQPPRPPWTPGHDWDGTNWGARYGVEGWTAERWSDRTAALTMPWRRN
ncbi:hypothetical protein ACFXPX_35965 [Kitasatospora sp. NPDC059146]|uniref:hypothetical protein n=1 Tax=Kitasatospora sp. NPDC059146 TaxID=3346741 RepID=UPI00367C74F1